MKNKIKFTKVEGSTPPELKKLILLIDYDEDANDYTWSNGHFHKGLCFIDGNKPTKLNVIGWADVEQLKGKVELI